MLKRIVIFGLCITLMAFTGCSKDFSEGPDAKPITERVTDAALDVPEQETAQFPLGLYINMGTGTRNLQTEVKTDFKTGHDLVVLSAFAANEVTIPGSTFGPVWSSYWDAVPELAGYKIGYCLSYNIAGADPVVQMIYSPKDTEVNREYLETYIYDDVNQCGWYSHLLESDMTEETVITSVKLTCGAKVSEVSEVKLEAFLYRAGDTENRSSSYTVTVERQ